MATNPMQRKSRNSFLLGVLLTLVITGLVIGLLLMQLKNYREEEATRNANSKIVKVLSQNVQSGAEITSDMFKDVTVENALIPSNAIDMSVFSDEEKIVAKVNLYANTIITSDMLSKESAVTTDDKRKQEYNMLVLPSQIETGEYIDVRLALPTGQDYIVISKKQIEIPEVDGIPSEDTIWLELSEDEIITMNNAIVDAYRILGSKLYVTTYTEAGNQQAATPTYVPNYEVAQLIQNNPNIVSAAKSELIARYNSNSSTRNDSLNSAISNSGTEGEENLNTKVEESITNSKETRKEYLESLGLVAE